MRLTCWSEVDGSGSALSFDYLRFAPQTVGDAENPNRCLQLQCRRLISRAALTVPSRPNSPRTRPAAWRARSCSHSHQECVDHQETRERSVPPCKTTAGPALDLRVVVLVSIWWVPAPERLCPLRRTRRISPV